MQVQFVLYLITASRPFVSMFVTLTVFSVDSKNSDLPRYKDTIQRRLEDKLAQGTALKAELEKKIPALVNSQCQLLDEHQPFGLQTISDLQCDCERLQNALNSVMHRKATAPKVFFAKFMLPRHTKKN